MNKDFDNGEGGIGMCPICGYCELDYQEMKVDEEFLFKPWICPKCGGNGIETYTIEFIGHRHEDDIIPF